MNTATTFGLTPQHWWLQFRRHLDFHRVRKMIDRQWRYALRLAENRSIPPYRAAELVERERTSHSGSKGAGKTGTNQGSHPSDRRSSPALRRSAAAEGGKTLRPASTVNRGPLPPG